jgi:hypothetical protein
MYQHKMYFKIWKFKQKVYVCLWWRFSLTVCLKIFFSFKVRYKEHWCKASKDVHARNAASEDELVDIWWPDILINFSMVNWFLPNCWKDIVHRHARDKNIIFSPQDLEILSILTIISKIYRSIISKVQLVVWICFIFHISFPAKFSSSLFITIALHEWPFR